MKKVRISSLLVLGYGGMFLLSQFVSGCFTEPTYSNTPHIDFEGFSQFTLEAGTGVGQQKRDSLIITIRFEDGDGDLGNNSPISSADMARYQQAGGWSNYRIRTFRLENNQYKELPAGEDSFVFFPQLSREGKTRAIEGHLELRKTCLYTSHYKNYPVKYRIQIRDRALNVSNEIETDTITVPFPNN